MFPTKVARAAGTGASVPVECCQVCGARQARDRALARLHAAGQPDGADRRRCRANSRGFRPSCCIAGNCELVQLGLAVDPVIIFPPEYPYTSGMTKLLRDNFAELYAESSKMLGLGQGRSRRRHRLQRRHADLELPEGRPPRPRHRADRRRATSPTRAAFRRIQRYFGKEVAREVEGASTAPAKVVTAANCFAHIEDVHAIVDGIVEMLGARRRVHLGVALSHRRCSTRCSTTRSITSTCATIRSAA